MKDELLCGFCRDDKIYIKPMRGGGHCAICNQCRTFIFAKSDSDGNLLLNFVEFLLKMKKIEKDHVMEVNFQQNEIKPIFGQYFCPICFNNSNKVVQCKTKTGNRPCKFFCFKCRTNMFLQPRYLYLLTMERVV